ncbi:DUF803-domain-containing protein [Mycena floridula]|nr:DUF803-domain-containing protein [Mycena floridula]
MVDDKYIGLVLAVSSSLSIGLSGVLTKKGLNASAISGGPAAPKEYLRNPIWWAGITSLIVGEIANFAAYTFAPPVLVTPLGALSVLVGAVLASFMLNESLHHLGRLGCALSLIGSLIIVLHAPEDKPVDTVDQILEYAMRPAFLFYIILVIATSIFLIFAAGPRYGRSHPAVYISICSLVGSVSVMAIKGFGVALKLTLGGHSQLQNPSMYLFGIVAALCIVVQLHYQNKAFDAFSVNIVNPMYYVGFSTATILASLILFQGFNTSNATETLSLVAGFVITFMGVHVLNLSRREEYIPQDGLDDLSLHRLEASEDEDEDHERTRLTR